MMQSHYSRRPCNYNVGQPRSFQIQCYYMLKRVNIEAIIVPKFQKGRQLMAVCKMDGARTVWDIISICTQPEYNMLPHPFRNCTIDAIISMSKL